MSQSPYKPPSRACLLCRRLPGRQVLKDICPDCFHDTVLAPALRAKAEAMVGLQKAEASVRAAILLLETPDPASAGRHLTPQVVVEVHECAVCPFLCIEPSSMSKHLYENPTHQVVEKRRPAAPGGHVQTKKAPKQPVGEPELSEEQLV